ncbi:hypothetical protein [Chamaesiphon sp.]|uniref:hypothetical protein n=1 Tax=Chamaesiphon sp. TaxID=2814140 RepID=UPI00359476E1
MLKNLVGMAIASLMPLVMTQAASAAALYGNQQSGFNVNELNPSTGVATSTLARATSAGGGIVNIGNSIFYTTLNDTRIYEIDTVGNGLGAINTILPNMAALTWDGSNFWATNYQAANGTGQNRNAYQINTAGNIVNTITLSNSANFVDALLYFDGKLIANRGFGSSNYDVYNLAGNLLQANFIDTTGRSTGSGGIAYDGTNFYIADPSSSSFSTYSGTGTYLSTVPTTSGGSPLRIQSLSFDYAANQNSQQVPEPLSFVGTLVAGIVVVVSKRSMK